jgi:hypothetical protein
MATGEPIDVRHVRRDDSMLDSLGQRRRRRVTDDPAARLLAALAADIDEEIVARRLRVGRLSSLPIPGDRGHSRLLAAAVQGNSLRRASRSAVVAAVAVAVLSISGVAAAVGGDALAPLKAVVSSVTGVDMPRGDDPAAASGAVERDLAGAEAAVSRGDINGALNMVAQAKARLPKVAAAAKDGLEDRLERIERRIAQHATDGPVSTVIVPPTPPPSVAVVPPPEVEPSPTPTEPETSPSPTPTAVEPTESPSPSPSTEPSDEPTPTPSPEDPGDDIGPIPPLSSTSSAGSAVDSE